MTARAKYYHNLRPPQSLINDLPLSSSLQHFISDTRSTINQIMQHKDHRLLVVVGPCSIHDYDAALEYGELLSAANKLFHNDLFLVMRAYFEKPRTKGGWKGFINDPYLDNKCDMNAGLFLSRKLLLELLSKGVPAATEFLDVITPQFFSDLITWVAVGARTSASQLHRELASSLPIPIGFKNNTNGDISVAIDAIQVASQPHHFLGVNLQGQIAIVQTTGNNHCHIILRGGLLETNYSPKQIGMAIQQLKKSNQTPSLVVDFSHGNSQRDYKKQIIVTSAVADQIRSGSPGIRGVMLESNLVSGKQQINTHEKLIYGQSITDGCLAWSETLPLLEKLALAVRTRKKLTHNNDNSAHRSLPTI